MSVDDVEDLIDVQPTPTTYQCPEIPPHPSDNRSLDAWQALLQENHTWASDVTRDMQNMVIDIQGLNGESSVVQRSAAIAVENVKQHIAGLRPRYTESREWADKVLEDQNDLLNAWSMHRKPLRSISVHPALGVLLRLSPEARPSLDHAPSLEHAVPLYDVVSGEVTSDVTKAAQDASQRFRQRVRDLADTYEGVARDGEEMLEGFSRAVSMSDSELCAQAEHLCEEVEVISQKITTDNARSQQLFSDTPKAVNQLTKTASIHSKSFLPSIKEITIDISQALQRVVERRNDAVESAAQYMQQVSVIESRISQIHAKLATLDEEIEGERSFDILSTIVKLPGVYGSLLVECVRRQEWNAKMKADISSVAEETATYREEESTRRRRWAASMGDTIDAHKLSGADIALEINVATDHGESTPWPSLTREDINQYIEKLSLHGLSEARDETRALARTLDQPSKAQSRRAKAFKNGTLQDGFGRNSLILRGDDDVIDELRSSKYRLEERLKSSDSRIRKLEDLLHRQSQMSKPSVVATFGPTSPTSYHSTPAKPQQFASRRSSTSSRRVSANYDHEEKILAQRIVGLEAELEGYREREVSKAKEERDLRGQIQEAVSTKEDLLSNMEAQQREFEEERRLIEHDNSTLKIRLEEMEEEFDKVLENNEHDSRLQAMNEELTKARSEASATVQAAETKTQDLQEELATQKRLKDDANQRLTRQKAMNSELQSEIAEMTDDKNRLESSWTTFMADVRSCFPRVDQFEIGTEARGRFIENVASAVERQAIRISDLEDSERVLKSDKIRIQKQFEECTEEISDLREDLQAKEKELDSVQRKIDGIKDHSDILAKEKLDLATRLQELTAIHESAETSHKETRENLHQLSKAHEDRASRAQEISDRLHRQNAIMLRLIEQIGYTVARQDDTLTFTKAPKVPSTKSSAVLNESTLTSAQSLLNPPPYGFDGASADFKQTSWTSAEDANAESVNYANFIREISLLDPSTFATTVVRRVKEADHLARKYLKEARAQREKARRAQVEAHDKIAFKAFKEGDLALFLPTRNQATRPWAAFNIGAPHYFLREQDSHKLRARDWLLARISNVEERVVDLSKAMKGGDGNEKTRPNGFADNALASDDNPFELSDGLRWYLLDAAEEKAIAPMNIATGKATVAAANVDARGSIRLKATPENSDLTKTLARSLDSRRSSSTNSKKSFAAHAPAPNLSDCGHGDAEAHGEIAIADGGETLKPPPTVRSDTIISAPPDLATEASRHELRDASAEPTIDRSSHDIGANPSPAKSVSKLRESCSATSPSSSPKKGKAWDSLWSLDLNLESRGSKK